MSQPPAPPPPPPSYPTPPPVEPPPQSRNATGCAFAAFAVAGVLAFVPIDLIVMLSLYTSGEGQGRWLAAVVLAVITFGIGGGLCFVKSPIARGLGVGLMCGWALVTIATGGLCTGLTQSGYW